MTHFKLKETGMTLKTEKWVVRNSTWSSFYRFKYRFFENYFDIPAVVLCAHVVDYIDEKVTWLYMYL
jgi:hypothetical protein